MAAHGGADSPRTGQARTCALPARTSQSSPSGHPASTVTVLRALGVPRTIASPIAAAENYGAGDSSFQPTPKPLHSKARAHALGVGLNARRFFLSLSPAVLLCSSASSSSSSSSCGSAAAGASTTAAAVVCSGTEVRGRGAGLGGAAFTSGASTASAALASELLAAAGAALACGGAGFGGRSLGVGAAAVAVDGAAAPRSAATDLGRGSGVGLVASCGGTASCGFAVGGAGLTGRSFTGGGVAAGTSAGTSTVVASGCDARLGGGAGFCGRSFGCTGGLSGASAATGGAGCATARAGTGGRAGPALRGAAMGTSTDVVRCGAECSVQPGLGSVDDMAGGSTDRGAGVSGAETTALLLCSSCSA